VQLARNFDLETVAEGVENDESLKVLRRTGCDFAQGFLFAKPMPAEAVLDFVLKRRAPLGSPLPAWPKSDTTLNLIE